MNELTTEMGAVILQVFYTKSVFFAKHWRRYTYILRRENGKVGKLSAVSY